MYVYMYVYMYVKYCNDKISQHSFSGRRSMIDMILFIIVFSPLPFSNWTRLSSLLAIPKEIYQGTVENLTFP